jgi:hypothetical protein
MNTIIRVIIFTVTIAFSNILAAQNRGFEKFKQLEEELPTPNQYHNAAGAPGHEYWQQKADYEIRVKVDDEKQRIYGDETITYYNNSPDVLTYLWLQLDQNLFEDDSDQTLTSTKKLDPKNGIQQLYSLHEKFDGGFKIEEVKSKNGTPLNFTVNKTMMRIDLATPLKPGASISFSVKWWFNIVNGLKTGARSGYEFYPEDSNYIYSCLADYEDEDIFENNKWVCDEDEKKKYMDILKAYNIEEKDVIKMWKEGDYQSR